MTDLGNQSTGADYSWMRIVLAVLYDEQTRQSAIGYIHNATQLGELRINLDQKLEALGYGHIPEGERGDNLLQALLTLRIKFAQEEATAKLEQNIAVRRGSVL